MAHIPFACWIIKATDNHSEYVILIAFSTTTLATRTLFNVVFTSTLRVVFILLHPTPFISEFTHTDGQVHSLCVYMDLT